MTSSIRDVSDTALWVAVYRAQESARPDPLFQDPLATVLAGERGKQIADAMPYPRIMNWFLVIRTVALDRLIQAAIEQGADTLINLGTGLDTRPYRMKLPPNLRWVEVDFPHIIDYKRRSSRRKSRCVDSNGLLSTFQTSPSDAPFSSASARNRRRQQ
jgi:methyltransferase (TIGR00027 family)